MMMSDFPSMDHSWKQAVSQGEAVTGDLIEDSRMVLHQHHTDTPATHICIRKLCLIHASRQYSRLSGQWVKIALV